ncbi:antitoxin [Labedaea rhizosphaerae]|uniref:Antitoxin protein of toxin-antitoxin system n=1 Tax=Labedaea rhizosphaerae TaxID=598644 RepID=A0A4R6SCY3_LABRH|nr:antitoxin [Labedaea rhizosphaerae]TDP97791.1 antitoxin protein of toxin-antitoxin system [Labedaea rhizosphaerae]
MPMLRKLTAVAGAAAAATNYAKRHPDKVNQAAAKAGAFIDKQTKGRYRRQIDTAMHKVRSFTGQRPDAGRP